jgi:hypothetical protein
MKYIICLYKILKDHMTWSVLLFIISYYLVMQKQILCPKIVHTFMLSLRHDFILLA